MDILSRKLLLDMPNAGLKCNSTYGQIATLKTVPASFSLCVTIRMTQEERDKIGDARTFLGMPNGYSWLALIENKNIGPFWYLKNDGVMSWARAVYYRGQYLSTLTDGSTHKLVCSLNTTEKRLKCYIDGVLAESSSLSNETLVDFQTTNVFRLGTGYNAQYRLEAGTYSNVKYFSFDISATGAAYTLDDYQNNRDIPDGTSGVILNLHNKLSGSTWQDESGNGYDMALQGDFEIVDI